MAERGEPKNPADDVEDIEGTIKSIKNIIALMEPLVGTVDSRAMLMYQILADELSKIRTTLNKEKIIQLLEEKDHTTD